MLQRPKAGFTLIELVIVVTVVGILAAIAIPMFIRFQTRAKQAEAKTNLRAIYTAQQAWFQEKDSYSAYVKAIGFEPERGNRYAYFLASGGARETRDASVSDTSAAHTWTGYQADTFAHPDAVLGPTTVVTPEVVTGAYGWFTAVAAGNADNDTILDEWSISSRTRADTAVSDATTSCASGDAVSGEPCNDVNDL